MKKNKLKALCLFFIVIKSFSAFAQDKDAGVVSFVKGNISEKISAVKNSASSDSCLLSSLALDFVIENSAFLGNDRDLCALAVATVLSLPQNEELLRKIFPDITEKLSRIFLSFDDETVGVAVLGKIESLTNVPSQTVSMIDDYIASSEKNKKSFSVIKKALEVIEKKGTEKSFRIVWNLWKSNSLSELDLPLENTLISLSAKYPTEVISLISQSEINVTGRYIDSIKKSDNISLNFKAEIAENALLGIIYYDGDLTENSSLLIELPLDCVKIISKANWTRSASLVVRYFSMAKEQFQNQKMTAGQFIEVINCLTSLSSSESVNALSGYLSELNEQVEKNSVLNQEVVLALIKSLGVLGDKSAFDNLLYVTYLNYPEEIKNAARDSLAKLKW